ncbi:MAG: hypothetical protein IJG68_00875 [Bacilli bacterium]|nr:hypothetical protein [Bacilli bacterium]
MLGENIVAAVIDVDCYQNTEEEIKYGGPKYLGFEFWVRKKEKEFMTEYVRCMLHEYNVPIINIRNTKSKIVNETELHTLDQIREVIENNKDHMFEDYKYYSKKRCK